MIRVGGELQFVENRLKDIAFIAEYGKTIDDRDPDAVVKILGSLATEALGYLRIARAIHEPEPSAKQNTVSAG